MAPKLVALFAAKVNPTILRILNKIPKFRTYFIAKIRGAGRNVRFSVFLNLPASLSMAETQNGSMNISTTFNVLRTSKNSSQNNVSVLAEVLTYIW